VKKRFMTESDISSSLRMNWLDISGIPRRFKAFLLKYRVVLLGAALIVLLVCFVGSNIILSPGTIMYGDFNTPR